MDGAFFGLGYSLIPLGQVIIGSIVRVGTQAPGAGSFLENAGILRVSKPCVPQGVCSKWARYTESNPEPLKI